MKYLSAIIAKTSAILSILLIAACAHGTGVLPYGPDTYTVTEVYAPIRGGSSTAKQVALTEANKFCEDKGLKFMPLNSKETVAPIQEQYGHTSYTVNFRCLDQDDNELERPNIPE